MNVSELISALEYSTEEPCSESVEWLSALPPESSAYNAWRTCERGDWLMWLVSHDAVYHRAGERVLRLMACDVADMALDRVCDFMAPSRAIAARASIDAARESALGKKTSNGLREASAKAYPAVMSVTDVCDSYEVYYTLRAALHTSGCDGYDPARAARVAVRNVSCSLASLEDGTLEKAQAIIVRRHVKWSTVRDALEKSP